MLSDGKIPSEQRYPPFEDLGPVLVFMNAEMFNELCKEFDRDGDFSLLVTNAILTKFALITKKTIAATINFREQTLGPIFNISFYTS